MRCNTDSMPALIIPIKAKSEAGANRIYQIARPSRRRRDQTSRNLLAAMPEPMAPASAPMPSMINMTVTS